MNTIYLIGNAHIDPVWLWKKSEGLSEILSTYRSALDRMKEFPDYIFTSACASYYQWVEQIDPAMFQEIRQRVEEGRWSVTGGMWVQPDCNLPSGEAFCRHTLYSQRYFQEHLGRSARVGYHVDSFGHNAMLPQLLKKSGMDSYVFMRPGAHENPDLPDLFWWEAPDGSRVLTHKIKFEYTDFLGVPQGTEPLTWKIQKLRELSQEQGTPYMDFYGVGNHGGGPTIRGLTVLEQAVKDQPDVAFASTEDYFRDVAASPLAQQLPVVRGSLLHHASGCYAACAAVKRANRQAENALVKAEKFALLAQRLAGGPSAKARLEKAWEKVLFNQFHDILAGCSIREAYDDALAALAAARDEAGEVTQEALHRLSWNIQTTRGLSQTPCQKNALVLWERDGEGAPVVVFNPHSFPVTTTVQLNTTVQGVCDHQGKPVPCQQVRGPQTNFGDKHNTLFLGELPAYGWALYYVFKDQAFDAPLEHPAQAQGYTLENQYLKVTFDPFTGSIVSFYDKEQNRELAAGPLGKALVIDDQEPDTWAHGINVFDRVVGEFAQAQVSLLEEGPLRASIRVETAYQGSTLRQDFLLGAHSREVEVRCRMDFREKLKLVKLAFPVRTSAPRALYSVPYGFEEHPLSREEFPAHKWVLAAGEEGAGLSLCNDGKYSFSILEHPQGAELRMLVARGCAYADHYGFRDERMEYQDQGEQFFTYTLSTDVDPASVTRRANLLNMAPELLLETHHQGQLEPWYQGVELEGGQVLLTAAKEAEDGDGWVVRLQNAGNTPVRTQLAHSFLGGEAQLDFAPQELKTLRQKPGGTWEELPITELEGGC
ncbi:MAG: alpha-mannosidase [Acutalibacter sp.]